MVATPQPYPAMKDSGVPCLGEVPEGWKVLKVREARALTRENDYLTKYFADSAGKKGGEFYTPTEVVRLLVQITKPRAGNTVYDPTVGSGAFLIQSHQYEKEQSPRAIGTARPVGSIQ
ncbi:MAG: SAM-dependent methyltransferase [Nitrococcus sp.]|nr:SAM-dependent methyltransferase [Nitrococcus sp.]